ncbi:MAG: hypothetical protein ABI776_01850 [Nocardioidaceae bacterium]
MEDLSPVAPGAELPVACTLGVNDGPARLQRWQHLHQAAAPTVQLADGELEVRYQPGSEVMDELKALVTEEQECCAFVSWAVTEEDEQPVLRVTAPPESPKDIEPIAALLADVD